MKTFICIVIAAALFFPAKAQQRTDDTTWQELALFQENTQRWMDAYNSKDSKNLLPLYSEDAEYISSHVTGLVAKGRDRLIANFQNGMNMGGHIDAVEILSSNISCGLATLLCRYQATNNGVTVVGRNLLVMKKINGKWLITLHMTVV